MDRAYDSHSKKFLVKETIPKAERLTRGKPSINKETNNKDCSRDNDQGKTFSTHPLDEAMQELLDICHQYNDKLSNHKKQNQQSRKEPVCEGEDKLTSSMPADRLNVATNQEKEDSKIICDRKVEMKKKDQFSPDECLSQHAIQQGNLVHHHQHSRQVGAAAAPEPIERLQEKQAELQRQLDEVQLVARKLASRRKRNLTDILEDREDIEIQDSTNKDEYRRSFVEEEEEDDELIEFQQIENELRISDLKRQLDNIQEELRIRLFKRLVSNTGAKQMQSRSPASSNSIENCSPSSSSCSDTPISSTLNNGPNALAIGLLESPSTHQREKEVPAATDGSAVKTIKPDSSLVRSQDIYGSAEANEEFFSASYKQSINQTSTHAKNHIRSNCSDLDSAVDYTEALTPTTSKESVMSRKNISVETATVNNLAKDTISPYQAMSPYVHNTSPVHPVNLRNNSANSDLERIEEDEDEQEDQDDYYCNSDKFRTIYEEKLSPKALGHVTADSRSTQLPRNQTSLEGNHDQYSRLPSSGDAIELISSQQRSNSSQNPTQIDGCVSLEKRSDREAFSNRPLTLYLPKPDEEIDLVEHVQRLGHDTSIISDDLKLSSKSAQGYLWKCCAKNTNKWLRRYFYYDRESKIVAYFKSEHQLAKKHPSPRDTIPFEEISDVYVNHQLSSLDDRGNRASKGRNFVFVLATIGRKYLLATSKAETMRAWIDILFTAAKANDYLEHMEDEDELNDANSDSFR